MAANKLSLAAQRIVIRRIVAGDTNEQVNEALLDADFKTVSAGALSRYRNRAAVKRWIERRDNEAMQQGAAQFGNRIRRLNTHADRLHLRLAETPHSKHFNVGRDEVMIPLSKEYRETLKDIDETLHKASMRAIARENIRLRAKAQSAKLPDASDAADSVLILPEQESPSPSETET